MDNLVEFQAIPRPADLPSAGSCERYAIAFTVDDDTTRELALKEVQTLAGSYKRIEAQRVAIKKPIDEATKAVQTLFKPLLDDNEKGQKILRDKCSAYDREQEQRRREEQARLEEAARIERQSLEAQAVQAAAAGHIETAAVLAATAEVISAPIALTTAAKIDGISKTKVWDNEIEDKIELLKSLIENPMFVDAVLDFKHAGLNNLARTLAGNVPLRGVRFFQSESFRVRAA